MKAAHKNEVLASRIAERMNAAAGHDKYAFSTFDFMETAYTLRRAEMVLHRWAEEECNGTIQRDDDSVTTCTQCGHKEYGDKAATPGTPCVKCGDPSPLRKMATHKPFRVWTGNLWSRASNKMEWTERRTPIADRETGALRRIENACKEAGLHYYHQTDPRGCALYVSTEPLNAQNYTNGIACSI